MKKLILLVGVLLTPFATSAQTVNDSILANERKIDRPITLHKGQFQINPAYEISILSKEYDKDGNKLDLAEQGKASVLHRYSFEFNYGILDFLQASISINYNKKGERKENVILYSTDTEPYYDISYFDDYKGLEDIYLGTIFKIPLKSNKLEFAISPGIYLPIFSNEPKAPEHRIALASTDQPFIKLNYHYHHKFGNGAAAIKFGVLTKIRTSDNFNIFAQLNYSAPISESESVYWVHQLNESKFEYKKIPYKYLISNSLDYGIDLEYQAISWFNVSLSFTKKKYSSGWTEITGLRIENPETKLSLLSFGYEIKATPKLWVTQFINIPVGGKNQLAALSIFTGISYNLFPFNNDKIIYIEDTLD